jgi:hypothetical protein
MTIGVGPPAQLPVRTAKAAHQPLMECDVTDDSVLEMNQQGKERGASAPRSLS